MNSMRKLDYKKALVLFSLILLLLQKTFASEIEKYEKELILLEDEAGRIKFGIIELEKEIGVLKEGIEENKRKSDVITREINNIMKMLFFVYVEKRINHLLIKDVETKNIRIGEYIKSLIAKYEENLNDLKILNDEYQKQINEMDKKRTKLIQERKALEKKIEEIYKAMDIKNKSLSNITQKERRLVSLQKEESLRKIDEVAKRHSEGLDKNDEPDKEGNNFKIIWPVRQGDVVREYGVYYDKILNLEKFSRGIVIKAPFLTEVYSVSDGKVIFAGWLKGFGNTIIIEHLYGFISVYSHLARIEVSKEDVVKEMDLIGFVGDTGSSEGVILYFELRKGGKAVDPMNYIK